MARPRKPAQMQTGAKKSVVTITREADYREESLLDHVSQYPTVALVLQGGGALGAYQCGVYEGLHEAGIRPNWFAGISIGAINAAIIAGNAPEQRVDRLREFWETICKPSGLPNLAATGLKQWMGLLPVTEQVETWAAAASAFGALMQGQRGFFAPWPLSPWLFSNGSPQATSFYDTRPLLETLERLIDFDRINDDDGIRLTVGATDVESGNFRYFDSTEMVIGAAHVAASGSLPPAFPAIEIEGRWYWDGGVVSNTPLEHVLSEWPRQDTLALQVDLWSARGQRPQTMMDVLERAKDIQYSSRTRHGTDVMARTQQLRSALVEMIEHLPGKRLPEHLEEPLSPWLDDRVFNIIHLIYQAKPYEEQFKDYAFNLITMRQHWAGGRSDTNLTLEHPHYFSLPDRNKGYSVHDVHCAVQRRDTGDH